MEGNSFLHFVYKFVLAFCLNPFLCIAMTKPIAVRFVRSDKLAEVCNWCPDAVQGEVYCILHDMDMVRGVCPDCIARFKADSLKQSALALLH